MIHTANCDSISNRAKVYEFQPPGFFLSKFEWEKVLAVGLLLSRMI